MDFSIPSSTTNSPLTPVFGDNVQDLLGSYALHVNPSAIITVNSTDDALNDPNSGVTTLRDAINQANGDTGEDLIVFDRSLFSNGQTISLNLGELDITHNLDIIAPRDSLTGADLVTVSGNNASRVFEIEKGATVNLDGLIVADGFVKNNNGGGIKNSGTLTLDSSIVRNNSAIVNTILTSAIGGGIFNAGNLTVSNSTISGNSAYIGGGGIYNTESSTVLNSTISGNSAQYGYGGGIASGKLGISASVTSTVMDSTISGNSAENGGGIFNGDTSTVQNSTISGNSATRIGGGIDNNYAGTVTLLFSTVTQNQAPNGGGVYQGNVPPGFSSSSPASVSARNTIIASNLKNENGVNPDVSGDDFTSNGYNLIGDSTGSTGFNEATGDIVGTSDNPIDPRLAPLDFNGGSTQTFALLPDSPAIGAGDPTVLDTDPTTDQRGFPRRAADGSADIGAFEFS